ncbi:DUF805 domain-containing protein [Macrococcus brunensis]|uniref:DUF805 domain-containing protein n=1 Tax=Macrococcus brunensis TaxID=198483 RepID=UPI001EEF7E87|nr:DUF805 domain-containing protein [Macrococcus brunensis]ULG71404.1 DUF805 domain-containing protein [Macrococcus brunensis]
MTWMEVYKRFWQNAFKMRGRARRKEYWVPVLINGLIALGLMLIFSFVDYAMGYTPDAMADADQAVETLIKPSNIVNWLWSLILLIPSFTVLARRLQDININGWWALVPQLSGLVFAGISIFLAISLFANGDGGALTFLTVFSIGALVVCIIGIVFFVFTVLDSKPGPNKYGEDPKKNERYYYKGEN